MDVLCVVYWLLRKTQKNGWNFVQDKSRTLSFRTCICAYCVYICGCDIEFKGLADIWNEHLDAFHSTIYTQWSWTIASPSANPVNMNIAVNLHKTKKTVILYISHQNIMLYTIIIRTNDICIILSLWYYFGSQLTEKNN